MPDDPEVARLLSDLKKWCDAKHGRRTYLAKIIGVDRKRISDWFAGRVLPSLSAGLKIKTFLEGEKSGREKVA
jgi:DNA-binding XRE family transcriptional regulator